MIAAIVVSAVVTIFCGGAAAYGRSAVRKREAFQLAWDRQRASESEAATAAAIAGALQSALVEQEEFERYHPVRYDWHQRQHAVRGRIERLLHARGITAAPALITAAVVAAIPHPPADQRIHVTTKR
jgi:hypothetical protein